MPRGYIPEDDEDEIKQEKAESFYDEYDVDPFETKPPS